MGGAALCLAGALTAKGGLRGFAVGQAVALLERRRVLQARGLIASCGRKQVEVRLSADELRAAPGCKL